uniref:Uncharacterized protein n=1 Tax=Knipowitschia caucasica TaxID=637954 RepID=A0AAV2KQK2_KNICA
MFPLPRLLLLEDTGRYECVALVTTGENKKQSVKCYIDLNVMKISLKEKQTQDDDEEQDHSQGLDVVEVEVKVEVGVEVEVWVWEWVGVGVGDLELGQVTVPDQEQQVLSVRDWDKQVWRRWGMEDS